MPELFLAVLEQTGKSMSFPTWVHLSNFPCLVGRGLDCDVLMADPQISRRHCIVDWLDGGPTIRDLGSSNGTKINGHRINRQQALAVGDILVLGATILAVHLTAEEQEEIPIYTLPIGNKVEPWRSQIGVSP
jgi:pSer/pThr/pTyr-binding forkhead associated (FHA) protein